MSKNIAIILSGCGVYDGTEIQEAVMTMLAVDRQGASYQCFAPDRNQHHVINHLSGEEMSESRNILTESARIARGNIKPLSDYNVKDYDALIFPGGFGAAKNLFTLAIDGADFTVHSDVEKAVFGTHETGKPIGALCISPVLLAKLFKGIKVTIGQDPDTIGVIEQLGADHQKTTHGELCIDEGNKLITTPCYMLDASITNIFEGADNLVRAVLERT